MGIASSALNALPTDADLALVCGSQSIPVPQRASIYQRLADRCVDVYRLSVHDTPVDIVEEALAAYVPQLVLNNPSTGNLLDLTRYCMEKQFIPSSLTFLVRYMWKVVIETCSYDELFSQIKSTSFPRELVYGLSDALIHATEIVSSSKGSVSYDTYVEEIVVFMTILCAPQLVHEMPGPFLREFMNMPLGLEDGPKTDHKHESSARRHPDDTVSVAVFSRALLAQLGARRTALSRLSGRPRSNSVVAVGANSVVDVAHSVMSLIRWVLNSNPVTSSLLSSSSTASDTAATGSSSGDPSSRPRLRSLPNTMVPGPRMVRQWEALSLWRGSRPISLLLLLALQPTDPEHGIPLNPFLGFVSGGLSTAHSRDIDVFRTIFSEIATKIGKFEVVAVLLYTFLTKSRPFRGFFLSRTDLDSFALPLLEKLYKLSFKDASPPSASAVDFDGFPSRAFYIYLILLLILSEDAPFCNHMFRSTVKGVRWVSDTVYKEINLGSLCLVVLSRLALLGLSVGDDYIVQNALATLVNMSPHMSMVHKDAAQGLMDLLDIFSRSTFSGHHDPEIEGMMSNSLPASPVASSNRASSSPVHLGFRKKSISLDNLALAQALPQKEQDQFLRMLLEAVNSVVQSNILPRNLEIVAALLSKEETLNLLMAHGVCNALVANLVNTYRFFHSEIAKIQPPLALQTHDDVLYALRVTVRHWRPAEVIARHVGDQRYCYEEEPTAASFFVPCMWTILLTSLGMPWDAHQLRLLTAGNSDASSGTGRQDDMDDGRGLEDVPQMRLPETV